MDVLVLDISREQESNIEQLNSIVITNQLNSCKNTEWLPCPKQRCPKKIEASGFSPCFVM
jgi:hypothetical protein